MCRDFRSFLSYLSILCYSFRASVSCIDLVYSVKYACSLSVETHPIRVSLDHILLLLASRCTSNAGFLRWPDQRQSSDMILLADQLLGSKHKTIQARHNSKRRRCAHAEIPTERWRQKIQSEINGTLWISHRYCSFSNVSIVKWRGSPYSSSSSTRRTWRPGCCEMNLSSRGQGVTCGRGMPVRNAVEIKPGWCGINFYRQRARSSGKHAQRTANTSPWKSDSRNLVRRKNALDHSTSRCSVTTRKWDSKYAISLSRTSKNVMRRHISRARTFAIPVFCCISWQAICLEVRTAVQEFGHRVTSNFEVLTSYITLRLNALERLSFMRTATKSRAISEVLSSSLIMTYEITSQYRWPIWIMVVAYVVRK